MLRDATRTLLLLALVCAAADSRAHARTAAEGEARVARGSLEEIRKKRSVALIVTRGDVVDVRDTALVAMDDYRKAADGVAQRPHMAGYRLIAKRLNKYINKYKSMTAAQSIAGAEIVIIFKVTNVRRSFIPQEPYVFGKMFVVAGGPGAGARVVWESAGERTDASAATSDFIRDLKAVRGEK